MRDSVKYTYSGNFEIEVVQSRVLNILKRFGYEKKVGMWEGTDGTILSFRPKECCVDVCFEGVCDEFIVDYALRKEGYVEE